MMAKIENFGSLRLAHRSGGEPVRLTRSLNEVVFLAFDTAMKRLVELHLLGSGDTLDSIAKKSAFAQAQRFVDLEGASFTGILSVQETQGLVSYTSYLNDGEFIADYIHRRGPLQPTTVFALALQLLEDILQLDLPCPEVTRMRLDQVMMTTFEDTFLQLRVYDYDLSSPEMSGAATSLSQLCRLLFLMLTGNVYTDQHPDRFPVLTSLPMGLRTAMRTGLMDPQTAPTSLERFRDHIREAFSALSGGINIKSLRRQRVITPSLQPRSELQDSLLENMQVHEILGNRFQATDVEGGRCYPFSLPCANAKNHASVTVQVLPTTRIVDRAEYQAAPTQMWSGSADSQPNVLRCLSLWEGPDWTFLTEERVPGFPLSRLLAERVFLNPVEVAVLLRQIIAGQMQAGKVGVPRLNLHPSNVMLCIGKEGPLMQREHERLMEKRLDVWPNFRVKVRAHWTMRHFYEAPLVEMGCYTATLTDQHYQSCMVVALAAYLLTGQRSQKHSTRFPEATPPLLADFIRECLEKSSTPDQLPSAIEFVSQFESLMSATSQAISLAVRRRVPTVVLSEMESIGCVSDFDNEWESALTPIKKEPTVKIAPALLKATSLKTHKRVAWETWAAVALVILASIGAWAVIEKPSHAHGVIIPTQENVEEVTMPNKQDVSVLVMSNEPKVIIPATQVSDVKEPPVTLPEKPSVGKSSVEKSVKVVHKLPQELPLEQQLVQLPSPPVVKTESAVSAVPPPPPAQEMEVVRKAILPSPEEVERFKQSLTPPIIPESPRIAFPFSLQLPISGSVKTLDFPLIGNEANMSRQ